MSTIQAAEEIANTLRPFSGRSEHLEYFINAIDKFFDRYGRTADNSLTEPTKIRSLCNTEGIHEIAKPSIISLDGCRVSIGGKEFQTEQTTQEEFLFELPEVQLPSIYEENRKTLHLKNSNQEQILQINTFANNLRITELQKLNE
ncbi:hypothetical protein HHI36_014594 [Cryptolaemus montrouzieri]|uniref:Uncharacterized protein n=1 Tax=Cryptolaemus montrouzieri TaxID=559131 RepID=A0ABD2N400_9CUCU